MLNTHSSQPVAGNDYSLWFESLYDWGRSFAFPCNAQGEVNLDALNNRLRANYLYARALVGRDYSTPVLRRALQ